jgi:hypothetical protein
MNRTQPMARGTVPIRPAATPPTPTPTPTQAVGAGMAMNPAETADYRELLNKQLMTESSKANASKYLSQAMQSSGVGQTGLAQSVLSGIEMGYQNMAAKNVAEYNLLQQEKQFESQQATLDAEAASQQENARVGFEFLQSAGDLDSLDRYYEAYYEGLNDDQKKAFDLVYQEKQRELGFVEAPTVAENTLAAESFGLLQGAKAVYIDRNEFASLVGNLFDMSQGLTNETSKKSAAALNEAFKASENWGNTRNGTVYKIETAEGNSFYGFYNGRWYKLNSATLSGGTISVTTDKVTRTFTIK